jgi:hypothetical protein
VFVYIPASGQRPPAFPNRGGTAPEVYDAAMEKRWRVFRIFFADQTGRIYRSEWQGRWECCST